MSQHSRIRVFGELPDATQALLEGLVREAEGTVVGRTGRARSSKPFPKSTDLELALKPRLEAGGFAHHHQLRHPQTGQSFEYDFWRSRDGIAMEIMGYRADDEVYKDILKFHVHDQTSVGVVWVPRWKWISGERTETNYKATMKALAFADSHLAVVGLVAVTYDWSAASEGLWRLEVIAP